jgi:hypothetical protein
MPAFDLPADELNNLVRYLRTLTPIPRTNTAVAARRTVTTTDGRTVAGQVLSEGMTDLQLRTDDKKIVLLRK